MTVHLSPEISRAALEAGAGLLARSGLLILVGLAAGALLRRRGPLTQALIYRATLVSVLACTLLSAGPAGSIQGLWRVTLGATSAAEPPATVVPVPSLWIDSPSLHAARPFAAARAMDPAPAARVAGYFRAGEVWPVLAGVWIGGTAALLLWLAACALYLNRLRRRALPAGTAEQALLAGLCADLRIPLPELRVSASVHSPLLSGLRRPAILLPAGLVGQLEVNELRAVLVHELTHLQRHDCWWGWGTRILSAFLWPQMLLWPLVGQLEQAQEEICDRAAVEWGCQPREYARCLLALSERMLATRAERAAGMAVIPRRSSLGRRIHRIIDRHPWSLPSGWTRRMVSFGAAVGVAAGLLLISTAAPVHSSARTATGPVPHTADRPQPRKRPSVRMADRPAVSIAQPKLQPQPAPDASTSAPDRTASEAISGAVDPPQPRESGAAPPAERVIRPPVSAAEGDVNPGLPDRAGQPVEKSAAASPASTQAASGAAAAESNPVPAQPEVRDEAAEPAVRAVPVADEDPGPATAAVTGHVLDPAGRPVAGVAVRAYPRKLYTDLGKLDHRTAQGEAVTGPDGVYRIEGLQGGLYVVGVRSEPSGKYVLPVGEGVVPIPGQTVHVKEVRMIVAAIVTGTVVDLSGQPVPDLRVYGGRSNPTARPNFTDSVTTDSQGRFRLRLGRGTNTINLYRQPPPGFRQGWLPGGGPEFRQNLLLEQGQAKEIRFRIDPERLPHWKEFSPKEPAHL